MSGCIGVGGSARRFPGEDADLSLAAVRAMQARKGRCFGESALPQRGLPLRPLEQRLLRTQIPVGQMPPAAGQAEDGLRPQLWRRDIHEHQGSAGDQQFVKDLQGRAHIGHGVKHIGADDEIIRVGLEALFDAGLFEIQHLVLHLGEGGQLLVGHWGRSRRRRR